MTSRFRSGFFKLLIKMMEDIAAAITVLICVTEKTGPFLSKIEEMISKKCKSTAQKPAGRTYLLYFWVCFILRTCNIATLQ